jgi:hypothetical protein
LELESALKYGEEVVEAVVGLRWGAEEVVVTVLIFFLFLLFQETRV